MLTPHSYFIFLHQITHYKSPPLLSILRKFCYHQIPPLTELFYELVRINNKNMKSMRSLALVILGFMFMMLVQQQVVQAQEFSPAPAPVSDGSAIDQGVAYLLLLLALAVTYLVH